MSTVLANSKRMYFFVLVSTVLLFLGHEAFFKVNAGVEQKDLNESNVKSKEIQRETQILLSQRHKPDLEKGKKSNSETEPEVAKKFSHYLRLNEVVLRCQGDARDYSDLLSDRSLIQNSENLLMNTNWDGNFKKTQSARIDQVNFLMEALKRKENPSKENVVGSMEKVILEARVDPKWPEAVRRAVVGDRIELYMALLEYSPQTALEISKKSQGDENTKRILAYATRTFEDLKRSENQGKITR